MGDKITEIDRSELPLLRWLYTRDLSGPEESSKSITCMAIDEYIRRFEQDPDASTHIKFFCLNGDFSNGTFVVVDDSVAHANTLSESSDEILRLLVLIDYSKRFCFIYLNQLTASAVREALKQKGIKIVFDQSILLYHLPKRNALELKVQPPDGIELKPIVKTADIQKAHDVWPNRKCFPVQFLESAAKYRANCGAFLNGGALVAWVFRFPTGLVMGLQTDADHFGHGYGSLVVRAICRKIANAGHDVYAGIRENNTASKALFGNLGFKHVGRLHRLCTDI